MKTCIDGLSQTVNLNGNMLRSLAGHFKSRAVRLITSIGVRVYYQELDSLRYQSMLHTEQQDLIEMGKAVASLSCRRSRQL
jgi:hypothetical protein